MLAAIAPAPVRCRWCQGRFTIPKPTLKRRHRQQFRPKWSALCSGLHAHRRGGEAPLPILTRAGIAHLYFVSIHPFEDGNGRIGRAISEKVISEGLGHAQLIALSLSINRGRKIYYELLERSNKGNEITAWLVYFAQTVLDAQAYSQELVEFLIAKTKFYDRLRGQFNERQDKAIARMMREGPSGFKGGLSAENYIRLTGTSRATATRDLQDLVEKKALVRTGALKGTRYHLPLCRQ